MSEVPYYLAAPSYQGPLAAPSSTFSMRDYQAAPLAPQGGYGGMATAGLALSGAGAVFGAIGSYQTLMGQRHQQNSEASSLRFQGTQSAIQARAAEQEAQEILRAGKLQAAYRGLVEAQDIGATRANAAARGVVAGTGSAGDVERSQRLAAELDKRTLRTNAERAAATARERKANAAGESLLLRASAANRRATADSINPALGAVASGLGSGGSLLSQWNSYYGRR